MNITTLLGMAVDGLGDRIAMGRQSDGVTFAELDVRARRVAGALAEENVERLAMVDLNSDALPLAMFGAAYRGIPFAPLNYRLTDSQLNAVVRRLAPATVVVGTGIAERIGAVEGIRLIDRSELLEIAADPAVPMIEDRVDDPDAVAVLLFTSGTSGEPKAAILRHRNLTSYILSTVEFASAEPSEAALVSVPPYHIAGVSSVLSNLYAGRRVVRMETFDAAAWVSNARAERVTQAMVVPTMLTRILDVLGVDAAGLPDLRTLSYGGGPMPLPVIERALAALPATNFVNAYGLTETSSTIAVLGPEDHRRAFASSVPEVRARLGSVGRPLASLEVSIRDPLGGGVDRGERGEIWVRGDQVSGEYLDGRQSAGDGWFATRDSGMVDDEGYLFVFGRLDDVIVRGGENLSPGEIEASLLEHPSVADAAVCGVPDAEWGEKVVAAVVLEPGSAVTPDQLREHVRLRLRSTCAPSFIQIRDTLPYNDMGKLLRRTVREEISALAG